MFPSGIEFIVHERQKDFLREAEQMRLINSLQRQKSNDLKLYGKVTNWLGLKMVMWGAKLQDYSAGPSSQTAQAIGIVDVKYPHC